MLFRKRSQKRSKIDRDCFEQQTILIKKKRKKKEMCSSGILPTLFPPKNKLLTSGKVSLCTSAIAKASLTLETALVLPLFFLGIIALISFMGIYRQQTEHLSELCQKVKEAGMYAYVLHGGGPEEIILPDVYSFQPVGGVIPIPKVRSINTIKVHAWTGAGEDSFQRDENDEAAEMVYVADNGTVYHTDPDCSYIKISIEQISGAAVDYYRNENGEKYSACEICSRHQEPGTCVYITGQGDRYHNSAACSGLKRSGRLVRMTDCGHLGACSRCSGN